MKKGALVLAGLMILAAPSLKADECPPLKKHEIRFLTNRWGGHGAAGTPSPEALREAVGWDAVLPKETHMRHFKNKLIR